jgi:hypothetical protein
MQDLSPTPPTSSSESRIKTYPVKWLEILALSLGGVGLIGAAIVGLGHKLVVNMQDPQRVEKIAKHMVSYQFPTRAQGAKGLSIGAESFVLLSDRVESPSLRLFIQKSPVDPVERTSEFVREMGLAAAWSGDWEDGMAVKSEPFTYCSQETELEIRKGNWSEAGQEISIPAIEYTLSPTIKNQQQTIRILATGANAEKQAKSLLRSIQCRR